jgi:outer membrane lipoprotein-sorting protein
MKYLGVFLLVLVSLPAASQVPGTPMKDVAGFKAKLESMSARITSIESDFVQEKNLSVLTNTIVSKAFLVQKENNIRWEYRSLIIT